jgi:hypothetical protein
MIKPALAWTRFLLALPAGFLLGLVYGFLRPLGRKYPRVADFLFLLCLFWIWLYHTFALCAGDFRFPYFAALFLGFLPADVLLGRPMYPLFALFWKTTGKLYAFVTLAAKKILDFLKKMFASGENGLQ